MNQQIKTSLGTAVIIIAAITAGAFVWISQENNIIETTTMGNTVKSEKNQAVGKVEEKISATQASSDSDINAIENELNSVNDEDFGDAALSDSEVGL